MNSSVSDLSEIIQRLQPMRLDVNKILLDPNNPRLVEVRASIEPEEAIDDNNVQEDTFRRLKDERLDDLIASISTVGYLPISMLVVRKHFKHGSDKYVVVEGNRRIAAIKHILKEAPPALPPELLEKRRQQLRELDVLLLDTDPKRLERDRYLLQGICHMSPVRSWPAYARAYTCYLLEQQGYRPAEISRMLGGGISPREVGRLLRAYYAYSQMIEDEEYGNEARKNREWISYFSEIVGSSILREWLGWDEDRRKFMNEDELKILYELLVKGKIRRMTDIRYIPTILQYAPEALDRLLTDEYFNIEDAYAQALQRRPPSRLILPSWRDKVRECIEILERGITLPLEQSDINLLNRLLELTKNRIEEIRRLVK